MRITTLLLAIATLLLALPLHAQTPIENPNEVFCEAVTQSYAHTALQNGMADDVQISGAYQWEHEGQSYASVKMTMIKTCNLSGASDREFERKANNTTGCWGENDEFTSRVYIDRIRRTITTAITVVMPAIAIGDTWIMNGAYRMIGEKNPLRTKCDQMIALARTQ